MEDDDVKSGPRSIVETGRRKRKNTTEGYAAAGSTRYGTRYYRSSP